MDLQLRKLRSQNGIQHALRDDNNMQTSSRVSWVDEEAKPTNQHEAGTIPSYVAYFSTLQVGDTPSSEALPEFRQNVHRYIPKDVTLHSTSVRT